MVNKGPVLRWGKTLRKRVGGCMPSSEGWVKLLSYLALHPQGLTWRNTQELLEVDTVDRLPPTR